MVNPRGVGRREAYADFGGQGICDCTRVGVACALLYETAAHRQRIHRARWDVGACCDTKVVIAGVKLLESGRLRAVTSPGTPSQTCSSCGRLGACLPDSREAGAQRFFLGGDCPCRQLLIEVFLTAHTFLVAHSADIRHPEGAARRHLSNRQHDYIRQRRGEMGAQVRTDRLASSAKALLLETEEQRRLLQDVADEAGSEAPLEGQAQLELRLAVLRGRRLKAEAKSLLDDIRRDLAVLAALYSSGRLVNVGSPKEPELVSWWEAYVERPLGRRQRMSDVPAVTAPHGADNQGRVGLDLPCPSGESGYQRVLDQLCGLEPSSLGVNPVIGALRQSAMSDPQGDRNHQLEATLRRLALAGKVLPSAVETFLADPGRRLDAVDALQEVLSMS